MAEIDLPDLARASWLGVIVESQKLAGSEAWAVTVREGFNRTPRRRWFPDRRLALCHAADQADAAGLPLFDRTASDVGEPG